MIRLALIALLFMSSGCLDESLQSKWARGESLPAAAPMASAVPSAAPYPAKVTAMMINNCAASGAPASQCACAVSLIQSRMTYVEYLQLNGAISVGGELDKGKLGVIADAIVECRGK